MLQINSSKDASVILSAAILSHKETWARMDRIEDYLVRSKPPFDRSKLEKDGYTWCANFNYNKGRSYVEKNVALSSASVMSALSFIEVSFNRYDSNKHKDEIYLFLQDERLRSKFSSALAWSLAEVLEQDGDFYSFIDKIEDSCFKFGHCSITRDNFSYLGHANHPRCIAYEDGTTFSNPQSWILFDNLKGEFLWRQYSKFKTNEVTRVTNDCGETFHIYESGWVKEGLLEVFKVCCITSDDKGTRTDKEKENPVINWENIEAQLEKVPYHTIINNVNNVHIIKFYYIDEDNNFIECYVRADNNPTQRNVSDSIGLGKYLLYKKNLGKKNVTECINIIRDNSINTDDTIAGLRGHGKLVAEDSVRFDMKKCKIEDKLTIAGSPIFKQNSALQGQPLKLAVAAGAVILGDGLDLNAQQIQFNLESHILSIQMDEQNFGRETFHLDPSVQGRLSSRPTTQEVQTQSAEVSRQRSAKTPIKFADYSVLFKNILIDLALKTFVPSKSKLAQELFEAAMFEELEEEGVTKDQLRKIIKEVNLIKLEPVLTDINAIREALGMADSTEARRKLMRMYLIALGFSRKQTNEFIKYQDYGIELSIATLENASFYNTAEIAFGSYQDHITHLNTHFAKFDRELQQIAAGGDVEKGFNLLVNGLTNTEKHIGAINGISFYKKRFKEFSAIQEHFERKAAEVAELIKKIQNQIKATRENQEGQQAIDPKVQADIYNDRLKTIEKIRRTEEQSQATMARKEREFETKMANLTAIQGNNIKFQQEMANMKKEIEALKGAAALQKAS